MFSKALFFKISTNLRDKHELATLHTRMILQCLRTDNSLKSFVSVSSTCLDAFVVMFSWNLS